MVKQFKLVPRLPLNSCEDLLEKVKWDHQQLNVGWSTYKTLDFILSANHLYKDWIDKAGSTEQKQRKREIGENIKIIFHCIGDLANASKHWSLDERNKSKQIVDSVLPPVIADWYAYYVAGPVIYVDILDSRLSMPELTGITLKCLDWLVHGTEELDAFDLDREIDKLFKNTNISK